MINTKATQNDVLLAIRMPKKLLDQLNALAVAKGVGTSTMARMTLIDYLKDEAPNALIGVATPAKPRTTTGQDRLNAMSPAERKAHEDDWNY
jgi:hypothetical protein